MRLVDAHCHLESDLYRDKLDDIIDDAKKSGLIKLITSSVTPDEWELSQAISKRYDIVAFTLGIHPWYVKEADLQRIDNLSGAKDIGAVAIGEIGLDKKIGRLDFNLQNRIFIRQLEIACDIKLPVIIHCRGAFNELLEHFKRVGPLKSGGIIHSFSGSCELAEEFIKYGLIFSMGGTLTYRNSRKREIVLKRIYPDYFLLETDSPDIPPVEVKDKLHVPANILYNLRAASEILRVSEEEIAEKTTSNALRMFNLQGTS